jgi:DNA-directed RNA polymerase specialized sigma24 family protein
MSDADDEPPLPTDHDGWCQIVRSGQLSRFPGAKIVAAMQAQYKRQGRDQRIIAQMAEHLSDRMMGTLRASISRTDFPNEGWDLVEAAHEKMLKALFSPRSPDGKGLRTAFKGTLVHRATDQARKAILEKRRFSYSEDPGVLPTRSQELYSLAEQEVFVRSMLDRVRDPQKRQAFELYMDGVPYGGMRGKSIAAELGISADKAAKLVKDAKRQLAKTIGKS